MELPLRRWLITLNPVRAGIVGDPADYRWSGYGERMANGPLQESGIALAKLVHRELGFPEKAFRQDNEKNIMPRVVGTF